MINKKYQQRQKEEFIEIDEVIKRLKKKHKREANK